MEHAGRIVCEISKSEVEKEYGDGRQVPDEAAETSLGPQSVEQRDNYLGRY